jgi:hypothetical protein
LAESPGGRAILRLGLQKAFLQRLWKTGKRGDIATQGEKAMFQLIADAETIRIAVWRAFTEHTSIEKTENVFSAAVQIIQKARSEFRESKPEIQKYLETIEENARANLAIIRREATFGGPGHAESLNEAQLLRTAMIGETMIKKLAEKLPADSKKGIELIENIVKTALGEKRND